MSKDVFGPIMDRDELKAVIKEAYKESAREFLNEKFAQFGRWSFYGLAAATLTAVMYFTLKLLGWSQPR